MSDVRTIIYTGRKGQDCLLSATVEMRIKLVGGIDEDLAAAESIRILKARYLRYVDMKDFKALQALFTDDAMLWFEGVMPSWIDIKSAMVMIATAVKDVVTVHHCHMPEIERTGLDSARAIWAMEDRFLVRSADGERWVERLHGFGHYHEDYLRRDGQWYIHRLKLSRLAVDRHDA